MYVYIYIYIYIYIHTHTCHAALLQLILLAAHISTEGRRVARGVHVYYHYYYY